MFVELTPQVAILATTAATVGVTHTAVGVDHTLPFVMLGRARQWSLLKTLAVTAACALGHVSSSVLIGALGFYGLGLTLDYLEVIEMVRGRWAAWLLIGFGVLYALLGAWRLHHGDGHEHFHVHADGTLHAHSHDHLPADGHVVHHHRHRGAAGLAQQRMLPALFVIFVLGPCESLIPLMAAPALGASVWAPALIAGVFGVATLTTMLAIVAAAYLGFSGRLLSRLEPHMQWLAGVAIALSGIGVELLGI
jgi:sulfite exporter TauE/SafE